MAQRTAHSQVILFLVLASLPLSAQIRGYLRRGDPRALQIARSFNTPQAPLQIAQVASDPGGFLWLATSRGLFRFDGQNLRQLGDTPLAGVAVTDDGWLLTASQEGLSAWQGPNHRKLSNTACTSVVTVGSQVVAVCDRRIWRGSRERVEQVAAPAVHGQIGVDKSASVWFGCKEGACELRPDGRIQTYAAESGVPPGRWPGVIRDDAGNLWVWDTNRVVRVRHGRAEVIDQYPVTVAGGSSFRTSRTRSGQIRLDAQRWIDASGEYRTAHWPTSMDLLRQNYTEDHLGQLWMASSSRGVSLLSPTTWLTGWQLNVDIAGDPVTVLSTRSGAMLAPTDKGLTRLDSTTDTWQLMPGALASDGVLSVAEARAGGYWVLFRSRGILRVDEQGRVLATVPWQGMTGVEYRVFHRDRLGTLWLGAKKELYRLDESSARLVPHAMPVAAGSPVAFARSEDGNDWLGYEAGIAKRTTTGWEIVVPSSALASPRIRRIAVGPGPTFWVCYRTTGPFSYVYAEAGVWKRRDFHADKGYGMGNTWSIHRDRRGWIWCGTEEGLLVSDGVHLAPQDWITLTETHNLPSGAIAHFGITEDSDGKIWVATSRGPAKIEPDPAWFSMPAGSPRLTRLRWRGADDFQPRPEAKLVGAGTLEIDFARWPGPTPQAAGTEFRLMPKESNWRQTTLGTVRYEDLEAGSYRFEMRPAEGGQTETFSFQVSAGSLHSAWIWLLAGAVVPAGTGYSIWRMRRRRLIDSYWSSKQAYLAQTAVTDRQGRLVAGDIIQERYCVESLLGEGGFSAVYRATDTKRNVPVAIKVLHVQSELPGWQQKRFESEINALAAIQHPGIVELLDHGFLHDKTPFLVMRYVEGQSLRDLLHERAISRDTVAEWVAQLGDALAAAHAHGVIHRDLKPENIIVAPQPGGHPRLVIVDFGAASVKTSETVNGTTIMLVSRDYAAPERIQGKSSPATDVYALSAITFEMLTGVRLVGLTDATAAGLRHALVGFPDSVVRLIAEGAAFDPANRPSDIGAFASDLARSLTAPG